MLSILHREMRIGSRRRWTVWGRVAASLAGFVIAFFLLLASWFTQSATGQYIFKALVLFAFWFSLIQGVRKAASSISDEKRDGTLGLLFLTPLRTIDIVAGKVFAVALPLVQPLLAFVPALAISVLLGGTTGGEIFRATLTLATILLYSISAGLFVSSVSRGEQTGQSTIFLLLASLFVPRILGHGPLFKLRYFSPWSAYATIPDPGYRVSGDEFWYSLLFTNVVSAAALAAGGFFLRRRWESQPVMQMRPAGAPSAKRQIDHNRRAAILDRNPGEWLAARHAMGRISKWLLSGAIFALCLLVTGIPTLVGGAGRVEAIVVVSVLVFLLLVRLASQASYPLAEARRCGAIEMMLSTPINPNCLITGQLVSLRNQFLPPFGMLIITSTLIITFGPSGGEFLGSLFLVGIFSGLVTLLTATVAAFGMWMGLRDKTPNAAFFKTMLFTLLPILLSGCFVFWVILPPYYLVLLLTSIAQLTGSRLIRLLRKEKKVLEMTPVGAPPPPIVAPPILKS